MNKLKQHEQVIKLLLELKKKYPNQGLGRHISLSLADYAEGWDISDKEFTYALEKYIAELDMNTAPDIDIQQIIKESASLESLRLGIGEELEDEENGY